MVIAARCIANGGTVRLGDRPVLVGDVITEPPELVAELLARGDFEPASSLAPGGGQTSPPTND